MPDPGCRYGFRSPESWKRRTPYRCISWLVLSSAWRGSLRSIRQQHVDPPESRRRAAMTDGIDLSRLALSVVRGAPLLEVARAGDPVAGLPQIRRAGLV